MLRMVGSDPPPIDERPTDTQEGFLNLLLYSTVSWPVCSQNPNPNGTSQHYSSLLVPVRDNSIIDLVSKLDIRLIPIYSIALPV